MTGCVSGCVIWGRHGVDCADVRECRGCVPRPADEGLLCRGCFTGLTGDLVDAPHLVEHLLSDGAVGPGLEAGASSGGRPDPAERSVLPGPALAADDVHATIAAWAHLVLTEHPDGRRMVGPDLSGSVVTRQRARRFDPDLYPPLPGEPTVWVHPGEVAGVRDPEATARLVRWLLPWLGWCAGQVWAGEMRAEVGRVVRTTWARWPAQERTRHVPQVPCPTCGRLSLVYEPPTPVRPAAQVSCSSRACGRLMPQEEFALLVRMVQWEHEHGGAAG